MVEYLHVFVEKIPLSILGHSINITIFWFDVGEGLLRRFSPKLYLSPLILDIQFSVIHENIQILIHFLLSLFLLSFLLSLLVLFRIIVLFFIVNFSLKEIIFVVVVVVVIIQ
jgi:hypothetical protein